MVASERPGTRATTSPGTRGDRDYVGMPAIVGTGTGAGVAALVCNHGYGNSDAASAAAGNTDTSSAVEFGPGVLGSDVLG